MAKEIKDEERFCDDCIERIGFTHRSIFVTQEEGICTSCGGKAFLTPRHALKRIKKESFL